jgi:hypothetical protein
MPQKVDGLEQTRFAAAIVSIKPVNARTRRHFCLLYVPKTENFQLA